MKKIFIGSNPSTIALLEKMEGNLTVVEDAKSDVHYINYENIPQIREPFIDIPKPNYITSKKLPRRKY